MKFTKKRITTMLVAMFTLVALCFSMVACSTPTNSEQSNEANTPTNETILAGGMQVGEVQTNGIKLMSASIPVTDYADYGIATVAETAVTINATIEPVDAVNQGVDWSIAWTNPSSAWASGKSVNDYVSLSGSGKSATVACLQPFGQQITVTATSQDNADIKAECKLEYAQKVTACSLYIGNISVNLGGSTEVQYEVSSAVTGMGGEIYADITTSDVYTIAEAFTKSVTFTMPSDTEQWFNVNDLFPTGMAFNDTDITNWYGMDYYFDYNFDISGWYIMQRSGDILFKNLSTEEIIGYLGNITNPNLCTMTLTLTGAHNTYTYSSQLVCTGYTNNTPVNALNLDTASYVF